MIKTILAIALAICLNQIAVAEDTNSPPVLVPGQPVQENHVWGVGDCNCTYAFTATAGDEIVIEAWSDDFDTVLLLWTPSEDRQRNDDFEDGSTNSRLSFTAEETGTYTVSVVRSLGSLLARNEPLPKGTTGEYEINLKMTSRSFVEAKVKKDPEKNELVVTEVFHDEDGIRFEGTMKKAVVGFGVCESIDERYTMDLWLVDYVIRNDSGRALEQYSAESWARSEKRLCTRYSRQSGEFRLIVPEKFEHYEWILNPEGLPAGQQAATTSYLLVPSGDVPAFDGWDIQYKFASEHSETVATDTAPSASEAKQPFFVVPIPADAKVELLNTPHVYKPGIVLEPRHYQVRVSAPGYETRILSLAHAGASPHRVELEPEPLKESEPAGVNPEPEALEPRCSDVTKFDSCWMRMHAPSTCYGFFPKGYAEDLRIQFSWTGACETGKAHGHGVLHVKNFKYPLMSGEDEGWFDNGKREGEWVERVLHSGSVAKGSYKNGFKDGIWIYEVEGAVPQEQVWERGQIRSFRPLRR